MSRKAKPHKLINGVAHKHCSGCDEWKLLDTFGASTRRWDGKVSQCRPCVRVANLALAERRAKAGIKHIPRTRPRPGARFLRLAWNRDGKRIWTKLYGVWNAMRGRCNSPGTKDYKRYGGRGIRVCAEWDDYDAFRSWALANGFRKGLTLDREDNEGDYEANNCRWIPKGEQQANTRWAVMLTVGCETKSVYEWARVSGIRATTINSRARMGWPHRQAVFHPTGIPRNRQGYSKVLR